MVDSRLIEPAIDLPGDWFVDIILHANETISISGDIYTDPKSSRNNYLFVPTVSQLDVNGHTVELVEFDRDQIIQFLASRLREGHDISNDAYAEGLRVDPDFPYSQRYTWKSSPPQQQSDRSPVPFHLDPALGGDNPFMSQNLSQILGPTSDPQPAMGSNDPADALYKATANAAGAAQPVTSNTAASNKSRKPRQNATKSAKYPRYVPGPVQPCHVPGCPDPMHETARLDNHIGIVDGYEDVPWTHDVASVKKPPQYKYQDNSNHRNHFSRGLDTAIKQLSANLKPGDAIPILSRNLLSFDPASNGSDYGSDDDDQEAPDADDREEVIFDTFDPVPRDQHDDHEDATPQLREYWLKKFYAVLSSPADPNPWKYDKKKVTNIFRDEDEDVDDEEEKDRKEKPDNDPNNEKEWKIPRDQAINMWAQWQKNGLQGFVTKLIRHHKSAQLFRLRVAELYDTIYNAHAKEKMRVPPQDSVLDCTVMKFTERLYVVAQILRTCSHIRLDLLEGNMDELIAAPHVCLGRKVASFWSNSKKMAARVSRRRGGGMSNHRDDDGGDDDEDDGDSDNDYGGAAARSNAPAQIPKTRGAKAARGHGSRGGRAGRAGHSKAKTNKHSHDDAEHDDKDWLEYKPPVEPFRGTKRRTRASSPGLGDDATKDEPAAKKRKESKQ